MQVKIGKINKIIWLLTASMMLIAFFPFPSHLHVLVALVMIAFLLAFSHTQRQGQFKSSNHPYILLMTLWLVVGLLSELWAKNRSAWLVAIGILFIASLSAYILTYLSHRHDFQAKINRILTLIILLHQVLAWVQWFTQQGTVVFSLPWTYRFQNPMLFFSNINDFALFQLFTLLFILFDRADLSCFDLKGRGYALVKAGLIPQALALLFFSTSRGILLTALLALVVYVGLKLKDSLKRRKWWLVLCLIALVMSLPFLYYVAQDSGMRIRFNLMRNGWHHLQLTHYLGVGAGNIPTYMAHHGQHYTADYTVMHNWLMGILVTFGLAFFIIYLIYYLYRWAQSYRLSLKLHHPQAQLTFTWLTAFLFASFIPNTLYHFIWFWLIHHYIFISFEKLVREGDRNV